MQMEIDVRDCIWEWVCKQIENSTVSSKKYELLMKYVNKEKKPTFKELQNISKSLSIPFAYFFLDEPPKEQIELLEFRTIDSDEVVNPSRELIDTINSMTNVQNWISDKRREEREMPLRFIGAFEHIQEFSERIIFIRNLLDIKSDWARNVKSTDEAYKMLRNRMSDIGIIIMQNGVVGNNTKRKLSINEFRAFTLVDSYAPLIFINNTDSQNGKLFSLLHEFAHVLLGENSLYNDEFSNHSQYNNKEKICNAIASEILVPTEEFIKRWNDISKDRVAIISEEFNCSKIVIARKALDLKFISKEMYETICKEVIEQFKESRNKKKKSSGGDFYKTLAAKFDNNLLLDIIYSTKNGNMLYTDAYSLTNTNRRTFERLTKEILGGVE